MNTEVGKVIIEFLQAVAASGEFQVIFWTVVGNVLLGVIGSIVNKDFSFSQLGDFVEDKLLKLVIPFMVVKLLAVTVGQPFEVLAIAAFAGIEIKLVASIYDRLCSFGWLAWLPSGSLTARE